MFDIIGNIVDFNDSRMKDDVPIKGSKSVQLLLEDLENIKLHCVLWEPYCHQVQGVIDRLRKRCGGHCVVIIQLCRTKAFRGEIGISNTYHATKVVVDPNLEEIVEFSNKLPTNGSTKSYSCSQLSNSSFISVTEELQSTAIIFMTLKELKASEATAKLVVDDESGGSGKDVSRLEFPSEVDSLIGRELLFKVGVESRHLEGRDHVYVVERICDDASIVKMHKSVEHKINDFPTRPYKDIVGDTNWDSNPQDDDIDAEIEYKYPERVLGKRGGEFCDEGTSSQLSTSSKRKVFTMQRTNLEGAKRRRRTGPYILESSSSGCSSRTYNISLASGSSNNFVPVEGLIVLESSVLMNTGIKKPNSTLHSVNRSIEKDNYTFQHSSSSSKCYASIDLSTVLVDIMILATLYGSVYIVVLFFGKIQLPSMRDPPDEYKNLLYGSSKLSKRFVEGIRMYNIMFSFTSMGGKIDRSLNYGRSAPIFRLNGENYHFMGSLLPIRSPNAMFAQLYIYDTQNEISNRMSFIRKR
ncbi:hypothetical protein OROMI_001516 [Orobanche minor]